MHLYGKGILVDGSLLETIWLSIVSDVSVICFVKLEALTPAPVVYQSTVQSQGSS